MDDPINSGSENKLPLFLGIGAIAVAILALALAIKARKDAGILEKTLSETTASVTALQGEVGAIRNSAAKASDIQAVDTKVDEFKSSVTANVNAVVEQVNAQKKILEGMKSAPVAKAPGAGSAAVVTAGPGEYVVKSGDTPRKIAAATGVSVTELLKANPGLDPKKLRVGQKIKVPGAAKAPAGK